MVRWDPFRDVTALRDEMNRLFSRTLGDTRGGGGAQTWSPALDVFETADQIVVEVDLPGLKPEDIDIALDDNVLTISGERRFHDKGEQGRFYRLERSYGHFQRSLGLPPGVKQDAISADFERGVLVVRVPKADEVRPRKIAVGAAAASSDGATG